MKHETTRSSLVTVNEQLLDELLPASLSGGLEATQLVGQCDTEASSEPRSTLGRYLISDVLGAGSFGSVYKAFDEQLQRHVAIKVPHAHRISSPRAIQEYLDEARTLAQMEHPNIVSVYDVGVSDEGVPYIVSAFVDGTNLAERMRADPLNLRSGLELIIELGRALAYIHAQGIVHRDVKPANVLLSQEGKPYLADFGLALREETADGNFPTVGTPAYMSPEQARGESHLVDGRSDIFSLGIVLYEMLVGKRPFRGRDRASIVDCLLHQEPAPLRQHNPALPRDLERICLKALTKRASERFSNAMDFVDDIEYFLSTCVSSDNSDNESVRPTRPPADPSMDSQQSVEVVPRGLRSYDRHDADFFCRLLPGPVDREWIPESLRFWQRQFENSDSLDPLRVGVLYGPSGCGKSSFVKAGLLPLLDENITSVFIEATRADTESRLIRGLRRRFPALRPASLSETLMQIREKQEASKSGRLLIVIDQFEQWLHGRADESDPELVTALRQCDGHTVQCLLLVRDDFWLALSRFMAAVEVPLRQNHNASLVDLFSPSHARRVLADFGIAYDRLPPNASQFTAEQNLFLDRAVEELCEGEKVFPVRLAILVEMLKSQPWENASLTNLGGIHGIGLQFLEEAFSSDLAPAAQRVHEPAVRKVLRMLLPDQGVDIKGNMQSENALREAAGYHDQPAAFEEMMRILDNDLRLVSPTDPTGTVASDESLSESGDGTCYYQLTHDYLVPAIEQWLTRRQRATRRGRAELRLAEYASLWASKPSPKSAPSWFDWLSISLWTSQKQWSPIERKMMRSTTRRHLWRTASFSVVLIVLATTAWLYRKSNHAASLVQQLQTARTADIPTVLTEIRDNRYFARTALQEALNSSAPGSRAELVNRMGLLTDDPAQSQPLVQQALTQDVPLLLVLREYVQPLQGDAIDLLTQTIENVQETPSIRLRAALLLAGDPKHDESSFWTQNADAVVTEILRHATSQPQDIGHLVGGIDPIAPQLADALHKVAADPKESQKRSLATAFLVQCLREKPNELLDFLLSAEVEQHEAILALLETQLHALSGTIHQVAQSDIDPSLPEAEFDREARRKGTAAALLHRLGLSDATWPLLRHSERPNARSYLTHRIATLGGDFEVTLARYARESDVSIRRSILGTLGTFPWEPIDESLKTRAIAMAKDAFENDPDSGIHSMADWALRRWEETQWIADKELALAKRERDSGKNWFVNAQGQTMAIIDGRSSPDIGRIFAISTKEVTVEQFLRYRPDHRYYENRSPTPDSPIGLVDWTSSVGYCRWLSEELRADPENSYPQALEDGDDEFPYTEVILGGAYRLPTRSEWQFACAAGTTSRRYYGSSDSLADHYFVYYDTSVMADSQNRYFPGGHKKPNDLGMFAMYDGVREWGHNMVGNRRPIFGGSSGQEVHAPATIRDRPAADLILSRNGFYGLRVAQTLQSP